MTADTIRAALRDCYDPDLPCNIVELGLIRSVDVELDPDAPGSGIPGVPPRFRASITVTPANPSETTEAHLIALIRNRLGGIEALSRVAVIVQHTPIWTPADITSTGRKQLGLDGNPALVQIR